MPRTLFFAPPASISRWVPSGRDHRSLPATDQGQLVTVRNGHRCRTLPSMLGVETGVPGVAELAATRRPVDRGAPAAAARLSRRWTSSSSSGSGGSAARGCASAARRTSTKPGTYSRRRRRRERHRRPRPRRRPARLPQRCRHRGSTLIDAPRSARPRWSASSAPTTPGPTTSTGRSGARRTPTS